MSWVTNVIVHLGSLSDDEEVRALEQVNEFFSLIPRRVVQESSFFSAEDTLQPQYMYPADRGFVSVRDASYAVTAYRRRLTTVPNQGEAEDRFAPFVLIRRSLAGCAVSGTAGDTEL